MTDFDERKPDLRATYRLQFRSGMTFERATSIVPYLAKLGISHVYASPIFAAVPGSAHGYDATDPNVIEPELGGEPGFIGFSDELKRHGLGLILDFVPNHMSASQHNPWWNDVLELGRSSSYADHFDIDWSAPRLVIPVLGQSYGDVLAARDFSVGLDSPSNRLTFNYGPLKFPLRPSSYPTVLELVESPEFAEVAAGLTVAQPGDVSSLKREFARLAADPVAGAALSTALGVITRDPARLHEIHEAQLWRLTHWRLGRDGLTYRRFFEITDLIGLTVDRPETFQDVHGKLLELVVEGHIGGIRLDHIDGLLDPDAYFRSLRDAIGKGDDFPILIEKILEPGEAIPAKWPVQGTTGYEFVSALAGLLVDPAGEATLTGSYEEFTALPFAYEEPVRAAKHEIFDYNLASELLLLTEMALALARKDGAARDIGPDSMKRAIVEVASAMPVYRTYVDEKGPSSEDLLTINHAISAARSSGAVAFDGAFDFLEQRLKLQALAGGQPQADELAFVRRFQQTTGPVMAKSVEDTAFYRINRLIALNEVGCSPSEFGSDPQAFHAAMLERVARQPRGLSATATHDTKRGEDARARIYTLSEHPADWSAAVRRWSRINDQLRTEVDGRSFPEPEAEWLFYQSLLGSWPADLKPDNRERVADLADRMAAFMQKAVREAKLHTSWTATNAAYESAVDNFVRAALDPETSTEFLDDFLQTASPLFVAGAVNSLTQTALKIAAPGVPDIYQGTENWDLSLVDPDNRRSVPFAELEGTLEIATTAPPADLLSSWHDGRVKQRLTHAGLVLRTELPCLFERGGYLPLDVTGPKAHHVLAFARYLEGATVVVIVPIRTSTLLANRSVPLAKPEDWTGTEVDVPPHLRSKSMTNVITGEVYSFADSAPCSDTLKVFPVALLKSG